MKKNISKYAFSLKHLEKKPKNNQKENKSIAQVRSSQNKQMRTNQGKPMNYEILKEKRKNIKKKIYVVPHAESINLNKK